MRNTTIRARTRQPPLRQRVWSFAALYMMSVAIVAAMAYGIRAVLGWSLR